MNKIFDWLRSRATQPSTWMGIAAAVGTVAASGGKLTPDSVISLMMAAGLIQIDENKSGGK